MQTTTRKALEYVSMTEAAVATKTPRSTLHKMIQTGQIKATSVGGRYIIPRTEVIRTLGHCQHCNQPKPVHF